MNKNRTSRRASLLVLLSSAMHAKPAQPPTLNQILQQLEANLNRYDARIPSFFCDEHVVSQVTPGTRNQNTTTDSIFRLQRILHPDHTTTLDEVREIKAVNNPATTSDIAGPTVITGAFEGGLALVSVAQSSCINYKLERIDRKNPSAPYIIHFASVLTPKNSATCLLAEESKGRAFIDPAAMQIIRMELSTPHHTIIPGDTWQPPITGPRFLTIDYAPVTLADETFWMPATITSRSTTGAGTFHQTEWTYKASYRNFHKLEVTSHIVPAADTGTP